MRARVPLLRRRAGDCLDAHALELLRRVLPVEMPADERAAERAESPPGIRVSEQVHDVRGEIFDTLGHAHRRLAVVDLQAVGGNARRDDRQPV